MFTRVGWSLQKLLTAQHHGRKPAVNKFRKGLRRKIARRISLVETRAKKNRRLAFRRAAKCACATAGNRLDAPITRWTRGLGGPRSGVNANQLRVGEPVYDTAELLAHVEHTFRVNAVSRLDASQS